MTDPAPRDRNEIEADLAEFARHGVLADAVRRLVADVRPLLDRLDATEKRLAAVEKLCDQADDAADGSLFVGDGVFFTDEIRAALAAVPDATEKRLAAATSREFRNVDRLAALMHDAYERAAVDEGWQTQKASAKPWTDVPEPNKATMRVAVAALLHEIGSAIPGVAENSEQRQDGD